MTKLNTNNKNFRKLLKVSLVNHKNKRLPLGKIVVGGKTLHNFSGNDYLGLSQNEQLIQNSILFTEKFGTSLSSSRLVTGNLDLIDKIEQKISKLNFSEKTLILGSGFQCNSTLIPALTENTLGKVNKAYIFSDKFNHSSINIGCLLSRQKVFRYNHMDLNHLEFLLKKNSKVKTKLIVTETLFSMDGDIIDINSMRFLAKKYNAILYLDEAHSLGVFGPKGFGIATQEKSQKIENEILVGTFSKSFGSYGSFVSCNNEFKDKIVNLCAGLIYSTALTPGTIGSIEKAVDIVPKMHNERKILQKNSAFVRKKLLELNLDLSNSNSHIIPIVFKNLEKCKELSKYLIENNFFVIVIRPPTVPRNKNRLRISLSTLLKKSIIESFVEKIKSFENN